MLWVTPASGALWRSISTVSPLVGSDNELASAQSAFSAVAERHDTGNDEYAVDHTAATYLVNSATQIQMVYSYGTASDEIVADLRRLVEVAPLVSRP